MNHHATVDTADTTITRQEIIRLVLYTSDLLLEDTVIIEIQLFSITNIEVIERVTTTIVALISDDIKIRHTTGTDDSITATVGKSGFQRT